MALPVPDSAAGTRQDIIRMLSENSAGLSDRELAEALAQARPGIDYKAVNHQCRKLVSAGRVERVGTRPVRTRLLPGVVPEDLDGIGPEPATNVAATAPDRRIGADGAAADDPDVSLAPMTPRIPPVQADVLAALAGSDGDRTVGLTDNEIAAVLVPRHPDVDPKAFNYQCRKLVKAGLVERTARSKDAPIRTRLTDAGQAFLDAEHLDAEHRDGAHGSADALPAPMSDISAEPPALRYLPFSASASVVLRERFAQRAALRAVPDPPPEVVLPVRDVHQGWSRTQNVAAAVATWIGRRGGTVRRTTAQGPALDLIARLDDDDVHVEVTGWPPDGARTHPSTLAADWFRAADRAAHQRRRAHPRARVVIALPDTRRYRSLVADAGASLSSARTEVWFVDAAGDVELD